MKIEFDFNAWAQLFESEPAKFEQEREKLLNEVIMLAHPKRQARMKGLKFRLDACCVHSNSNVLKLISSSRAMWDSFNQLNDALQSLSETTHSPKKVKLHLVSELKNKRKK